MFFEFWGVSEEFGKCLFDVWDEIFGERLFFVVDGEFDKRLNFVVDKEFVCRLFFVVGIFFVRDCLFFVWCGFYWWGLIWCKFWFKFFWKLFFCIGYWLLLKFLLLYIELFIWCIKFCEWLLFEFLFFVCWLKLENEKDLLLFKDGIFCWIFVRVFLKWLKSLKFWFFENMLFLKFFECVLLLFNEKCWLCV